MSPRFSFMEPFHPRFRVAERPWERLQDLALRAPRPALHLLRQKDLDKESRGMWIARQLAFENSKSF